MENGRDTEIDLIEHQMEGGVLVIQWPSILEDIADRRGKSVDIERDIGPPDADAKDWEAPTD